MRGCPGTSILGVYLRVYLLHGVGCAPGRRVIGNARACAVAALLYTGSWARLSKPVHVLADANNLLVLVVPA